MVPWARLAPFAQPNSRFRLPDRNTRIDPEPFSVIVSVAAIAGGVASVISTFRAYAKDSLVDPRRKALNLVDKASETTLEHESPRFEKRFPNGAWGGN
jgi:hypothetical protein